MALSGFAVGCIGQRWQYLRPPSKAQAWGTRRAWRCARAWCLTVWDSACGVWYVTVGWRARCTVCRCVYTWCVTMRHSGKFSKIRRTHMAGKRASERALRGNGQDTVHLARDGDTCCPACVRGVRVDPHTNVWRRARRPPTKRARRGRARSSPLQIPERKRRAGRSEGVVCVRRRATGHRNAKSNAGQAAATRACV